MSTSELYGVIVPLTILAFALTAWVLQFLWNFAVVSAVTWANPISYSVSVGLLILFVILKGMGQGSTLVKKDK